ncbi:hypothetical protein KIPB_014138, partial [Kipferlia bialata]
VTSSVELFTLKTELGATLEEIVRMLDIGARSAFVDPEDRVELRRTILSGSIQALKAHGVTEDSLMKEFAKFGEEEAIISLLA